MGGVEDFIREDSQKSILKFLTCGSVDDGKSTLIGRLLHDSKLLYEDQLRSLLREGRRRDSDDIDFSVVVDGLQAEREQGITIDVAYRYFSTKRRKFIIADVPGHEQYTRNMVTGASNSELAVILIDARNGVLTQTKRHTFIVDLLGIRNVIVAVNKMDLVDYDEGVFNRIKADYGKFIRELNIDDVVFIPISALKGDNVVEKSTNMPWYTGKPLMNVLEEVEVRKGSVSNDFRFPVQYVIRKGDFRGYSGTVVSGVVRRGDSLTVLPSGITSKVKYLVPPHFSVAAAGEPITVDSAGSGDAISIVFEDDIDVSRGNMLVKSDSVPEMSDCFDAYVVWMHEEPLVLNRIYYMKRATTLINMYVDEIYHVVDVNALEEKRTDSLSLNEIGYCRINLYTEIAFDRYAENRYTGSFIVIDRITNYTVGAGMIFNRNVSRHIVWHKHRVDKSDRVRLKSHKPAVIWFTGLSASGKSTIANALEEKLNRMRVHTYLLDGDNVRYGLNKDLGFSKEDRTENIRRIGEVAKLFVDAGLVVITSFISPYKEDRLRVRSLVDEDEFVEVYVNTPLEICEKRDPKGLYRKARKGLIKGFTGIDSPYEPPEGAEVEIKTEELSVDEAVEKIIRYLKEHGII